jgi:toxin-antitoxin system PIN domain toxin
VIHLLDGNVLVALLAEDHVHHDSAKRWLQDGHEFATCPITQGTLIRFLIRFGASAAVAMTTLADLAALRSHSFWPDDLAYGEVDMGRVVGHRQVTDAYLAQLARRNGARLLTLDQGLSSTHSDVAELLGTE